MSQRWLCAGIALVGIASALLFTRGAHADAAADQATRCATRLSVTLVGRSADPALLTSTDPQSQIDTLLQDPDFIERMARFINANNNPDPGATPSEDASYWLTKEILSTGKPWSDLFVGKYNVDIPAGTTNQNSVMVTSDANGLGYFRSMPWLLRYAGNEPEGYKISTGYRMMQNVIGLELVASTNAPGADITATGRMAQPCAGCHFEGPFALDRVAEILTRRGGTPNHIVFTPSTDGPQMMLGQLIHDDGEFVNALVNSDSFRFHACRLAFQFITGRSERQCEAPLFDKCMDAMTTQGTMQSALKVFASDPGFCQ